MTEIQIIYDGPIVKRSDAKADGLIKYFTGNPCTSGHIDQRYVAGGKCESCNRIENRKWKEYHSEYKKKIRSDPEYRAMENKKSSDRYKLNPKDQLVHVRNRQARIKKADGRFTKDDIISILDQQKYCCVYCSSNIADNYHIDHIMPISKGGSNWPSNLQCLCPRCNQSKSDKLPEDWHKEIGYAA